MSELRGKVGSWELQLLSAPRGDEGSVQVQLQDGRILDVAWRRDIDGIRLILGHGAFAYDLEGAPDDEGRIRYRMIQRGTFGEWGGLTFTRESEASALGSANGRKKGVRVRAQMPGKILRILVQQGASVEKGQALLVMEAMKMENEIKSPQAGVVGALKVSEGQAVETGADLLVVDPQQ